MKTLNTAAADVLGERQRQIDEEGHTPARDDARYDTAGGSSLAIAAASLALKGTHRSAIAIQIWPWGVFGMRRHNHRENCVKAAALLLAEIERIDRRAARVPA